MEKLKYAIYFCKSIDTDEYARVAMVEPTEATVSENNSDLESEVSEEIDWTINYYISYNYTKGIFDKEIKKDKIYKLQF